MKGSDLVSALKRKFRVHTDVDLHSKIGVTQQSIQDWKARREVTSRQAAGLVYKASKEGAKQLQASAIRHVVEFFPIRKVPAPRADSYLLFDTLTDDRISHHKYFQGLKSELESSRGVYIFFDSRGQAIYSGKAKRQSLWKEMNSVFNRERRGLQTIKRVLHPTRNQVYRTNEEKVRQIVHQAVPLSDLAEYFSAYQIADGLIDELEAMLVRSFANDLLNKKMEKFGKHSRSDRS